MRRPFTVHLSPSAPQEVLHARLEFVSPPSPKVAEHAKTTGEHFFNLANTGALCGDSLAPAASGIGTSKLTSSGSHVDWLFTEVRIDPLSIHLLLNLIHAFHANTAKVRSVHVGWSLLPQVDNPTDLAFPKITSPLPFAFSHDEEATSFDIILDFAKPQSDEQLEVVNETLGHWLCAVEAGAYGDESTLPPVNRVKFESEEPCMLDSESLVWSIRRFQSTAFALAGMVNVVSRIHQTLAPIQQLEISG